MKFQDMIYYSKSEGMFLLAEGRHLGYHYVIISYMTHPCCYVEITNPEHPYYKKQYDDIDIQTGGTISYSRRYLKIPDENGNITQHNGGWWIGWDYMRTGYHNFNIPEEEMSDIEKAIADRHKWTTEELIEECESVIYQLASKIEWNDIFDRWTEPGEYQKNKELGRIESLNNKS